ncbi:centrosomal protein of 120 kDa-like [Dreissena polymorpha]|uniref:centrosomal protein of 120 kDa-like n=1 Tax=Dreissena polymorpha TaxID=45954 RepID=UPI002263F402|nr:centrosomal protein of 120 kDa-like [Dreissena polymorpha]
MPINATMVEKDRFLVVVAVLEGRRFPKRPRHQLIAEAKFNGELLTTDPVDHVESPDFTQELAWELDKKGLHQHRLQRTSVKIQCYALDPSTSVKEPIGYVVLDLRSAHNKQTSKWYPLLLGKYQKSKPELRLGLYLDEDKSEENTSFKAKEAPPRLIETPVKDKTSQLLKPVLNEEEGYYQLGPPQQCSDQFVLSVTIATATNLAQLIPSTLALPSGNGFFFYFSLFGNDVTNEVFHDLINPQFPAERASVRVRSSVEALRMFFTSQPGLQVHLCCGEQSLGRAEVPLNSLLKKSSTEIYMKPVSVEGSFELVPPNRAKQQMTVLAGSLTPVVGLSVVLRKEDLAMKSPVKEDHLSPIRSPAPQSPHHKARGEHRSPGKGHQGGERSRSPPQGQRQKAPSPTGAKEEQQNGYADDFEEATHENVSSFEEERNKEAKGPEETELKSSGPSVPGPRRHPSDTTTSTTQHHVAIPPQSHHFSFSIDLRSVKSHDTNATQFVFLRYTYPFFGSAAPILTHPPVEIRKGMEVLLPQSFCAFDFACNVQQLQETFLRVPLLVELWNRDKQLSKDVFLGAARLPLGDIIVADKTKIMNNSGNSGWKQLFSNKVPIISTESQGKHIGELAFVLSLEDWGAIGTQQIVVAHTESTMTHGQMASPNPGPVQQPSPRETEEYKAAMELEMWKEEQEHVFENQLKQKEMMYMKALAEEWKKRDRERELLMKKKLTEYAQLEEQLRKTLVDLEKREKQLAANEQEVMRLKTDLQREHDRKLQEMKEASRRMKDDCDHLVDLEKAKSRELESLIQRYKDELTEAEKRKAKVEKDFTLYKEELNTKPEVRLQSEINLLTLEKVELERKLDAVTKSKIHYKQQWGRALKELARVKQKEQAQAKAHLIKQQQELEHMRLRYLAAEEKEVVNSEKQELEDIKNELNKLKQMEEERLKSADQSPRHEVLSRKLDQDLDNLEEHITRLIEERDTLLRTGVYSTQDKIIAELDRQIREAMANKKLNNV